jgi:hypothetical protein
MRAVTGVGCNKAGVPTRTDLPLHDMTGGNYWAPDAILYQNTRGLLRLGGALTTVQIDAIQAGKTRAQQQLALAASLAVTGNQVRVTNLTGHKLISGYPEGRRMWLNVKWYDAASNVVREDGAYGPVSVQVDGSPRTVNTLLDREHTRIYEVHTGMTQQWATQLLGFGLPANLALSFDATTGAVTSTLGQLAAQAPGTSRETFHFALNNTIISDDRIPPYGMSYDAALQRNTLPVPATQYGSPSAGGTFDHFDIVSLSPPQGAHHATVRLMYQPTSWEYVQFLYLANKRQNAFLANEGVNLLDTWLNTNMAEPYVMASASWETSSEFVAPSVLTATASGTTQINLAWTAVGGAVSYEVTRRSEGTSYTPIATPSGNAYTDTPVTPGTTYLYRVRAFDSQGNATAYSPIDLATTVVFTDDPLVAGQTTAKAVHITELRTAVDAVRTAAGLGAGAFRDDPLSPGTLMRAIHITQLRAALDEARSAIGVPPLTYTDPSVVAGSTQVKAAHIQQLRAGCQ